MRKKVLAGLIPLVIFIFFGCKSKIPKATSVQYEVKTFDKSDKPCNAEKNNCSYLHFEYPNFTQASTPEVKDALNKTVQIFILDPIFEKKTQTLDDLSQDFFAENQKLAREFPEAPGNWWVNRNVKVLTNSPQVVSLSLAQDAYLGGAHPNSVLVYSNLNPSKGSALKLVDLFVTGYESKLLSLAEKKFREMEQIPPQANLNGAGFSFKGGTFSLPDNFSIGEKRLTFYYNPYEIAPYARGPITLSLDYQDLQDLILPEGILGSRKS